MAFVRNVTVFVLATTALFQRIEDIQKTWGSVFQDLFFVMGTNRRDYHFLMNRSSCVENGNGNNVSWRHRRRLAKVYRAGKQTNPRDSLELYKCQLRDVGLYNILYAGNCTGEYYGIGPTCRCQAAMRFFIANVNLMFRHSQWFIFSDDDVYIRPFAVQKLLEYVNIISLPSNEPIALVQGTTNRGFHFSHIAALKSNDNACCSNPNLLCRLKSTFAFGFAQPAFLNRNALMLMSRAVDSNGLTRLQSIYGGSHDILLGLLIWMHQIKTFTFEKVYYARREFNITELLQFSFKAPCLIALHRATKRKRRPRFGSPAGDWTCGHADFARKMNDTYNFATVLSSDILDTVHRQEECGKRAFDLLAIKPGQNSINKTKFSRLAKNLSEQFSLFLPEHCAMIET